MRSGQDSTVVQTLGPATSRCHMTRSNVVIPLVPATASRGIEARQTIHPRGVRGVFSGWRWALILFTQTVFYGLPWLQHGGRQAVLFDLGTRRFLFFDAVLFPQDLILLAGLLIFSALLLFAVTALFGRVWCGFACPQTVYTQLFLWIEHRIEGDRYARMKLDAAAWGPTKLLRRGSKQAVWALVALVTGFTLVGWFTPIRTLATDLETLSLGPWEAFWILFYGSATYLHAGILREQICLHACPYGRFQGSMLDPATRVVTYDDRRGEPRGAHARGVDARDLGQGDCVDCTLCVQVCPVGIDIRRGLQAACISCGLCIDACNSVMDKLQAPRGLISFQATAGTDIVSATRRPRVIAYALLLTLTGAALAYGWWTRPTLRLDAMRDRTLLSRHLEDGSVENVYQLRLTNASWERKRLTVQARLAGAKATQLQVVPTDSVLVDPAGVTSAVVTLRLDSNAARQSWAVGPAVLHITVSDMTQPQGAQASAKSTFFLR